MICLLDGLFHTQLTTSSYKSKGVWHFFPCLTLTNGNKQPDSLFPLDLFCLLPVSARYRHVLLCNRMYGILKNTENKMCIVLLVFSMHMYIHVSRTGAFTKKIGPCYLSQNVLVLNYVHSSTASARTRTTMLATL